MLHIGAYDSDRLVRTSSGWRVSERTLEMVWMDGTGPAGAEIGQSC